VYAYMYVCVAADQSVAAREGDLENGRSDICLLASLLALSVTSQPTPHPRVSLPPSLPPSPSLPLPPPPSVHALRMCKRERQMFGTRRKGQNERRGGAKAAGLLRQHAVCMQHQGDTAPRVVGAGGGQEAGGERQEDSKIARA